MQAGFGAGMQVCPCATCRIQLAKNDYQDVLIGEEIDPWVIGEIKKYKARREWVAAGRLIRKNLAFN